MRRVGLGLIAVLILSCYAVPYLLLGEATSWRGSFLFWTLAGVLVIVFNAMATAGFGKRGS